MATLVNGLSPTTIALIAAGMVAFICMTRPQARRIVAHPFITFAALASALASSLGLLTMPTELRIAALAAGAAAAFFQLTR